MHKTRRLTTLMGLLLALFFSLPAQADRQYSDLVVFGDSLSDPGNAFVLTGQLSLPPYQLIPDAPYAIGGGHFSNGKTWAERFARELHLPAGPALRNPRRFSNYAVGGSRARAVGPVNLTTQVNQYLDIHGGAADPDALYVVFIGGNDLRDALAALASDPTGATSALLLQTALTAIGDNMGTLIASGARHFLVVNGPDLSLVPAVRLQGPAAQGAALFLATQFNQGLAQVTSSLQALFPQLDITSFDLFGFMNAVVAQPGSFGLRNVTDPCITPGVIVGAVCRHPNRYLFWDGIHPTRKGHRLIAHEIEESLEAATEAETGDD